MMTVVVRLFPISDGVFSWLSVSQDVDDASYLKKAGLFWLCSESSFNQFMYELRRLRLSCDFSLLAVEK